MTATVPVAFDPNPLRLGLTMSFKATSAVLMGQVVGFSDTGVSRQVVPATTATGPAIGVALATGAANDWIPVAMQGSIVKVMLSVVADTLDAGHWVSISAVAGMCIAFDPALGAHDAYGTSVGNTGPWVIGQAIDDIAAGSGTAGGTGHIVVDIKPVRVKAS